MRRFLYGVDPQSMVRREQSVKGSKSAAGSSELEETNALHTSRSMNLKGQTLDTAAGRCVRVLYDEGGSEPAPHEGVVVYAEPAR